MLDQKLKILTGVILAGLIFYSGAFTAQANQSPQIASFYLQSNSQLKVGGEVYFYLKACDPDGDNFSGHINFGDGQGQSFSIACNQGLTKSHIYETSGIFEVTFSVKDEYGGESQQTLEVEIVNNPPQIESFYIGSLSHLEPGGVVYFFYKICDPNSDPVAAYLDFGDGQGKSFSPSCELSSLTHRYDEVGSFIARLEAQDDKGKTSFKEKTVRIEIIGNLRPNCQFSFTPGEPVVGENVWFVNRSTDPDDKTYVNAWFWNFGDTSTTHTEHPTHSYSQAGRFLVKLEVRDTGGLKDTCYQYITVKEKEKPYLVRVNGSVEVYQIINGQYHWIPKPEIFRDYGFDWSSIETISSWQFSQYKRASLFKAKGKSQIYYLTEKGLKRYIPSQEILESYGRSLDEVIEISQLELDFYPVNNLIRLNGKPEVYKLEQGKKYWIKNPEIFKLLGYKWENVAPVNRTEFDWYEYGGTIS